MSAKVDLSSIFDNALPMAYVRKITLSKGSVISNKREPNQDNQEFKVVESIYGKKDMVTTRSFPKGSTGSSALDVQVDLVLKDVIGKNGKTIWFNNDEFLKYLNLRVVLCIDKATGKRLLKKGLSEARLKRLRKTNKIEEIIVSLGKPEGALVDYKREKIAGKTIYSVSYSVKFSVAALQPNHVSVFAATVLDSGHVATSRQAYAKEVSPTIQGHTTAEVVIEGGAVKNKSYMYTTPNNSIWAGPMHSHEGTYMAGAFHSTRSHDTLKQHSVPNFIVHDHRLLDDAEIAELQLKPDSLESRIKKRISKREKTQHSNNDSRKEKYMSELFISRSPSNASNLLFHMDFEKIVQLETQFGALFDIVDAQAKTKILSNCKMKNLRVFRHRVKPAAGADKVKDVDWEERTEMIAFAAEDNAGLLPLSIRRDYPDSDNTGADPKLIGAIKETKITGTGNMRTFSVSDFDMSTRTDGLYQYSVSFQLQDGTVEFAKNNLERLVAARKDIQHYYAESTDPLNYDALNDSFKPSYQDSLKKKYPVPTKRALSGVGVASILQRGKIIDQSLSSSPWVNSVVVYVDCLFNLTNLSKQKASSISSLLYTLCNSTTGNSSGILILIEKIMSLEQKIKGALGNKGLLSTELEFSEKGKIVKTTKDRPMIVIEHRFKESFDSDVLKFTGYDFLGGERRKRVGIRSMTIEQYRERIREENDKYFSSMVSKASYAGTSANFSLVRSSYLTPKIIDLGEGRSYNLTSDSTMLWYYKYYEQIVSTIMAMKPDVVAAGKDRLTSVSKLNSIDPESDSPLTVEENTVNITNSKVLQMFSTAYTAPVGYEFELTLSDASETPEEDETKLITSKSVFGESFQLSTEPIEDIEEVGDQLSEEDADALEDFTEFTSALIGDFIKSKKSLFGKVKNSFDGGANSMTSFDLRDPRNVLDKHVEFRRRTTGRHRSSKIGKVSRNKVTKESLLSVMPNQIKSVFFSNKNFVKTPLNSLMSADPVADPRYEGMLYYNLKMINRIEVFTGYPTNRRTGEKIMTSDPFKQITREILSTAKQKDQTLLCRMSPYSNNILGFSHNKKLSLPIYDEYFILSPRPAETSNAEGAEELAVLPEKSTRMYADLLTAQGDLNNTGFDSLKSLLESAILETFIEPEYVCTAEMVSQPMGDTKFGTKFSSPKKKIKKGFNLSEMFEILDPLQSTSSTAATSISKKTGGSGMSGGGSPFGSPTGGGNY